MDTGKWFVEIGILSELSFYHDRFFYSGRKKGMEGKVVQGGKVHKAQELTLGFDKSTFSFAAMMSDLQFLEGKSWLEISPYVLGAILGFLLFWSRFSQTLTSSNQDESPIHFDVPIPEQCRLGWEGSVLEEPRIKVFIICRSYSG